MCIDMRGKIYNYIIIQDYKFWSIGYCGEIPSNENGTTLLGTTVIIGFLVNSIKFMGKLISRKIIDLIVSSLFAKVFNTNIVNNN